MGWVVLAMLIVEVVAAFTQPVALVPLVPLNGFAFWYWRRLLKRDPPEFQPATKSPPADQPQASREHHPSTPPE